MKRIFFVYVREKDNPLFSRAQNEIAFLNGEIAQASEDYIPISEEEKFEEELKITNFEKFGTYILMKIYHFIYVFYGIQILRMEAEFVMDENGIPWLVNISRVHHKGGPTQIKGEISKTVTNVVKDQNDKLTMELEKHFKELERKEAVKLLNTILQQKYENAKRIHGINMLEVYYEDDLNDELFAKIHPDAPFRLSDLLRTELSYEQIREYILKNSNKLLNPNKYINNGKSPAFPTKSSSTDSILKIPGLTIRQPELGINLSSPTGASVLDKSKNLSGVKTPNSIVRIKPYSRNSSTPLLAKSQLKSILSRDTSQENLFEK